MNINKILKEFVKECSEKLNLMSIVQFGSSTYLEDPPDIDLVFFSKDLIFPREDHKKLFLIIKNFEKKYFNVSFDMSTPSGAKKEYRITIVPLQKADLIYQVDKFFLRNLLKDKNKKILFGSDPLSDLKISFTKREIIEKLTLETNWYVRARVENKSLRDLKELISYSFKAILRIMLIEESFYKKEDLLKIFKKKYPSIKIPKNAISILDHKVSNQDYDNVLGFAQDCIKFMDKK